MTAKSITRFLADRANIRHLNKSMYHGEERNKTTTVENGKTSFIKREKFCNQHGWIDLFPIGGIDGWQARHGLCGTKPQFGAEFETPKVMKKAA